MTQTSTPVEVCLSFVRTGESPETIFSEERRRCGRDTAKLKRVPVTASSESPERNFMYDS